MVTQKYNAGGGRGSIHSSRPVRNIKILMSPQVKEGSVIFQIEADGFLRYMVRNIVGTLVDVGLGKLTHVDFKDILQSKNRSNASATAPPHGLFLMNVKY